MDIRYNCDIEVDGQRVPIDYLHLTLVHSASVPSLWSMAYVSDRLLSLPNYRLSLTGHRLEKFGPNRDVPVLTILGNRASEDLLRIRRLAVGYLDSVGLVTSSTYSYNPHVSLPAGLAMQVGSALDAGQPVRVISDLRPVVRARETAGE